MELKCEPRTTVALAVMCTLLGACGSRNDERLGEDNSSLIGGPLGDIIGSNDLGQGRMRWDLDANAVVWQVTNGLPFPNTVGFNGTNVYNVTGDAGGGPLPVEEVNVADGSILSTFTLVGTPGGAQTHLEDLAFTSPTDLWGADIFNLRLVRYDITTGLDTLILPITGNFMGGAPVQFPTAIAATPLGMYASLGFGSQPPEIGVIDVTTGVYTPLWQETSGGFSYIHSLAYDSQHGVLWLNLSFAIPGAQTIRPRFLDGTSAGPDIVLNPAPVNGRFDGFEHLSTPVEPGCGDGTVDPGEECDDGNNVDGDGCSADCMLENQPPVAQCTDVSASADGMCLANASVDNGSFDPDGDAFTCEQVPTGPYGLGVTTVTLTCTDEHGASSSCTGTVSVADDTAPTFTHVPRRIKTCDKTPKLGHAKAVDNCSPVTITNDAPRKFHCGTTIVTWTATDAAGNTSTATQKVTRLCGHACKGRHDDHGHGHDGHGHDGHDHGHDGHGHGDDCDDDGHH